MINSNKDECSIFKSLSFTILQDGIKKQLMQNCSAADYVLHKRQNCGDFVLTLGNDINLVFQINHGNLGPSASSM